MTGDLAAARGSCFVIHRRLSASACGAAPRPAPRRSIEARARPLMPCALKTLRAWPPGTLPETEQSCLTTDRTVIFQDTPSGHARRRLEALAPPANVQQLTSGSAMQSAAAVKLFPGLARNVAGLLLAGPGHPAHAADAGACEPCRL